MKNITFAMVIVALLSGCFFKSEDKKEEKKPEMNETIFLRGHTEIATSLKDTEAREAIDLIKKSIVLDSPKDLAGAMSFFSNAFEVAHSLKRSPEKIKNFNKTILDTSHALILLSQVGAKEEIEKILDLVVSLREFITDKDLLLKLDEREKLPTSLKAKAVMFGILESSQFSSALKEPLNLKDAPEGSKIVVGLLITAKLYKLSNYLDLSKEKLSLLMKEQKEDGSWTGGINTSKVMVQNLSNLIIYSPELEKELDTFNRLKKTLKFLETHPEKLSKIEELNLNLIPKILTQ